MIQTMTREAEGLATLMKRAKNHDDARYVLQQQEDLAGLYVTLANMGLLTKKYGAIDVEYTGEEILTGEYIPITKPRAGRGPDAHMRALVDVLEPRRNGEPGAGADLYGVFRDAEKGRAYATDGKRMHTMRDMPEATGWYHPVDMRPKTSDHPNFELIQRKCAPDLRRRLRTLPTVNIWQRAKACESLNRTITRDPYSQSVVQFEGISINATYLREAIEFFWKVGVNDIEFHSTGADSPLLMTTWTAHDCPPATAMIMPVREAPNFVRIYPTAQAVEY